MVKSADSDMRRRRSPAKRRRNVVVWVQLPYYRSLHNWVVYLTILTRENLFSWKSENWEQNTPSNSPRAHGTP